MTTRNSPEAWDKRYAEAEMVWSLEPNEFVVEYLSDIPAGKMLDLGGGEGRNALWFASRGWRVENSDFSAVAVEKFLKRAEHEGLTDFCTGTAVDATNPESCVTKPVDLAVMAYLQIPAADLAAAIATAAQSLRSGGTLFGVWHARENLEHGFGGAKPRAQPHARRATCCVRRPWTERAHTDAPGSFLCLGWGRAQGDRRRTYGHYCSISNRKK